MSIELDWNHLTTGQEGQDLADSIRDFIHDRFQQVQLPRFIRSVHVHSFEFGKESPVIELKDISDPLPQFYEDDSDDEGGQADVDDRSNDEAHGESDSQTNYTGSSWGRPPSANLNGSPQCRPQSLLERRLLPLQTGFALSDHLASPISRSATPGILGSTSNINSYFNLPLSAGLSKAQTPLAAVASGTAINQYLEQSRLGTKQYHSVETPAMEHPDSSSRPLTSANHFDDSRISATDASKGQVERNQDSVHSPYDTQITLHISYTGSLSLTLTAEISLDYPMPSLVGIPVRLSITGLSFDGVALLAYLKKRANFCFLGREDAQILLGSDSSSLRGDAEDVEGAHRNRSPDVDKLGGLLKEMKVESEIGRMENGRQALKNVGKVEKFILEQVRKIFEDELVWPSWWTFLV